MPMKGWMCPTCQVLAPLDHYYGDCPEPPFPDYWAREIVKKMEEDDVHVGSVITPSTLLACPRSVLISRLLPYYALPSHFDSPSLGSALHLAVERGGSDLGYEVEPLLEANVPGIGPMKGRPDLIRTLPDEPSVIKDTKLTNQGQLYKIKKKKDGLAKPDPMAQLSFYRIMYHKQKGVLLSEGEICYVSPLSGFEKQKQGGSNWSIKPVKWMDIDELLAFHPFDGSTTVAEHNAVLRQSFRAVEEGADAGSVIEKLPIYGWTYIGGTGYWCKEYCEVNHLCALLGAGDGVIADWQKSIEWREEEV